MAQGQHTWGRYRDGTGRRKNHTHTPAEPQCGQFKKKTKPKPKPYIFHVHNARSFLVLIKAKKHTGSSLWRTAGRGTGSEGVWTQARETSTGQTEGNALNAATRAPGSGLTKEAKSIQVQTRDMKVLQTRTVSQRPQSWKLARTSLQGWLHSATLCSPPQGSRRADLTYCPLHPEISAV